MNNLHSVPRPRRFTWVLIGLQNHAYQDMPENMIHWLCTNGNYDKDSQLIGARPYDPTSQNCMLCTRKEREHAT